MTHFSMLLLEKNFISAYFWGKICFFSIGTNIRFFYFLSYCFHSIHQLFFRNHEVIVEGRRLGWTKKSRSVEPLSISKQMFLHTFKSVTENAYDNFTYYELKQAATAYQDDWKKVKAALNIWTKKNVDLLQFK